MIRTRKDLKCYLEEDKKRCPERYKHLFFKWLTRSDEYYNIAFMRTLRHYEFYLNKNRNIFDAIPYYWYWWNYRRLKIKLNFFLPPNVAEAGFFPVHPGYFRTNCWVHIGKNCTLLPMVLIGKMKPGANSDTYIGDNCYISTGVTILGPVKIGNNVTIGAGAVVNKDIPDNAVVAGVPAKIIKIKTL